MSKEEQMDKGKMVQALDLGWYHYKLMRPGEYFRLVKNDYSDRWMRFVDEQKSKEIKTMVSESVPGQPVRSRPAPVVEPLSQESLEKRLLVERKTQDDLRRADENMTKHLNRQKESKSKPDFDDDAPDYEEYNPKKSSKKIDDFDKN